MKSKMYILILLFIPGAFQLAQAQHPELITDRPDQTESSAVVPVKFLQIETGMIVANETMDVADATEIAYNTTLLRYGLFSRTELRLGMEYLGTKLRYEDNVNTPDRDEHGFSPLYLGFKTQLASENGLLPEIAFLGGLVLPFTADKVFQSAHPAADMRLAFAHTLTRRLSLGYNLGASWNGNLPAPWYFYSAALGAGLTDKLGTFVELYGEWPENTAFMDVHQFDAGLTYLLYPNLQLDISGGIGLNAAAMDQFISAGISWRIPE